MTATAPHGPGEPARGTQAPPRVARGHPTELLNTLAALPTHHPSRPACRDQAIEAWLPLAHHLAHRYTGRGEPVQDLVQTATVGLIHAIDRFDSTRGSDFAAFAVPTIIGEIKRYFRDQTWDVRVPRRLQELRLAITASAESLTQQLGHTPTSGELAAELEMSQDEVMEGMAAARAYNAVSLDAPAPTSEHGTPLSDMLGNDDEDMVMAELRVGLGPALAELPQRERHILRLRFCDNLTQVQIAERVGVSQMHVSRLLARSLEKLRKALLDEPGEGDHSAP